MSLHYIIDGYNVLKKIPQISNKRLKDGRQGLLDLIKKYNLCGKNEVTIIFDGRNDIVSAYHRSPYVVRFSEGESADELIKKMVKKSKNPKRIIMVSDDKELKFYVKRLNAKTISVKEFTKKMHRQRTRKSDQYKLPLKKDEADKITQEFKKMWLK